MTWPDAIFRYGYRKVSLDPRQLGGILEFRAGSKRPAVQAGLFLTPDLMAGAEARRNLALTYEPGCRMRWAPSQIPTASLSSLYGRRGHYNRTWPAYGQPGGGHEILFLGTPGAGVEVSIGPPRGGNYDGNSFQSDFLALARGNRQPGALTVLATGLLAGLGRTDWEPSDPAIRPEGRPDDDKASLTVRIDENGVVLAWGVGQRLRYAISAGLRRGTRRYRLWAYAWLDDEVQLERRLWGAISAGDIPTAWLPGDAPLRQASSLAAALKVAIEDAVNLSDGRRIRLRNTAQPLDRGY